ncbi:MAG: hypothetical protein JSW29_04835 [Candidatus Bathyarchaeota archaeon]|nr:MAG: hypothetical protein JSW29_04835 [Candidatus Bathyarchaeota archaeon]
MIEEEGNRVALAGQEIDEVKVTHIGGGGYGPASYSIYYGVRRHVEGVEKLFRVRMKIQIKGSIRREVIDFKWVGGELADDLNKDDELNKHLLQQLKTDVRRYAIEISPDKKAGIVWIITTKYMPPFPRSVTPFSIPDDLMPSESTFQSYNAIARLIRNRVSPQK